MTGLSPGRTTTCSVRAAGLAEPVAFLYGVFADRVVGVSV
ncbi:hypothetical protein GGR01_001407 [Acetobacter oeni]|nr:hypothetical protein [Acetobacter oeni]